MQIKDISDTPDSNEVHWKGVDVFLIVLGILLIFFFAILTIGIWSRFHALSTLNITPSETIGLTGLEGIALIGGVYLMGIRRRRFRWRDIGLRELNQKWLYISIVSAVVVIPLSGIIAELILMALATAILRG